MFRILIGALGAPFGGLCHPPDLECSGAFAGVLRSDAVGKACPVGDDSMASWAAVASYVQDEPVASWAQGGPLAAEVARPSEAFQVGRSYAEPDPRGWVPPVDLFDYGIDLCADRRVEIEQLVMTAHSPAELLDHVDRSVEVFMPDDFDDHAPWVMTHDLGSDTLTRDEGETGCLETVHARHRLNVGDFIRLAVRQPLLMQ
jgi:hypothetical protein